MLIEHITDTTALLNKTVVITGGGGGIALEAGKALAYMGANIIIGEVNEQRGRAAESCILEIAPGRAHFLPLDLTDTDYIYQFCSQVFSQFGCPYAIIHNATITPFDSVKQLSLKKWDESYLVHLRGPLQLMQYFLPHMQEQNQGAVVFMSSSGAVAYMGGYEVFKTAQVELANTLSAELEDTGVSVFSFGPGLVKTKTAMEGIQSVAPLMGLTTEEFYELNQEAIVSPEEAGTALAVSLLSASRYDGQEIGGVQVLMDAGIGGGEEESKCVSFPKEAEEFLSRIVNTYDEQYDGWQKRNIFERQWTLRDFKKCAGTSADEISVSLHQYLKAVRAGQMENIAGLPALLTRLKFYYQHQLEMMRGYIKDPEKRQEYDAAIQSWIRDIEDISAVL